MSGKTIRDVVIQVQIEAQKMRANTSDVTKAIDDVRIRPQLSFDDASVAQQTQKIADLFKSKFQNQMASPIKIGMPGYGQSVRDRAENLSHELIQQMRQGGDLNGMNGNAIEGLRSKLENQAKSRIQEHDKEQANAMRASAAAARESNEAVMNLGRGMAHLLVSSQALPPELGKTVVQVEGFTSVARGMIGVVGGPWTAAIVGGVAALELMRQSMIYVRDEMKLMNEQAAATTGRHAHVMARTASINAHYGLMMSHEMPDNIHKFTSMNVEERAANEESIRMSEQGAGFDWSRRAFLRQTGEQEQGIREARRENERRTERTNKRRELNQAAMAKTTSDMAASEKAHQDHIWSLEQNRVLGVGEAGGPFGQRRVSSMEKRLADASMAGNMVLGANPFTAPLGLLGMTADMAGTDKHGRNVSEMAAANAVDAFGGISRVTAKGENLEVTEKIAKADADHAAEKKRQQEDLNKLEQEAKQIEEEGITNAVEKVKVTKEQVELARQIHEHEHQTNTNAKISVGMMDLGTQQILRRLDQKRKAGGQFTHWDIQFAGSHAPQGTKLHDFARERGEKSGEGVLEYHDQREKEAKEARDKAEARYDKTSKDEAPRIDEAQQKAEGAADRIVEGFKSLNFIEVFEQRMLAIAEGWRKELDNFRRNNNRGPG